MGFAAFLDLRDSTYLWNQNPDLAEETLSALARTVEKHGKDWQGQIGNFTGDGFLVLFPLAEYAVRGLAAIIENWEPQRQKFCRALEMRGAQPPDDCSLMVRTGVAHGHYRFFRLYTKRDVAGEAINRASRCEGASKEFFSTAQIETSLCVQQRIFVTQDAFNLIRNKTDYWYSEKLSVQFKGYERPSSLGLQTTPDHIVAVWPKTSAVADAIPRSFARQLQRASKGASKIDAADRLVAAAADAAGVSGPPTQSSPQRSRDVLLGAIMSYSEALEHFPETESQTKRAEIHSKLGLAHASLAELLPPQQRRHRLQDALQEFRTALMTVTLDDAPEHYAVINANIAAIRKRQAELAPPAERAEYITEAVRALREVLKVNGYRADPVQHSLALSNLGIALGAQADFLSGPSKLDKWIEVVATLRQALAVIAPSLWPEHYASVQSDLSNSLRMQATLVEGVAKDLLLTEAAKLSRESARNLDAQTCPSRYANAQINFGLALLDIAQVAPKSEAMLKLAEATDAFREALKANTAADFPLKHAQIQENLALALRLQANALTGSDRVRHLNEARGAYENALAAYGDAGHHDAKARIIAALASAAS